MAPQSFDAPKQLRVTLTLAPENSNGVFPGTNSNTLVLTGLRIVTNVQTVPSVSTHADVKIFGMREADMNALTVIFFNATQGQIRYNRILLEANAGQGWVTVFQGMITEAQPEYRGAPNVYFSIQAVVNYQQQIAPATPSSYRGAVAATTVLQDLANNMGLSFENDGVTGVVTNPYLPGTYANQLNSFCKAADLTYTTDGSVLAVWPRGQARTIPPTLTLSPTSGLIGYPTLEKFGIVITSLYNPALYAGGKVQVTGSKVPNANGLWSPFLVDHQLEANIPGGAWFSVSQCIPVPQ